MKTIVEMKDTPIFKAIKLEITHCDEWSLNQIRQMAECCGYTKIEVDQQIPQAATATCRIANLGETPDEARFIQKLKDCDWMEFKE